MDYNSTYYQFNREDMQHLIPENVKRILDVGCAGGKFGELLKNKNPGLEVTGIEIHPEAARQASKVLDRVITGNIEELMDIDISDGYFDCIIYADVLEHLRNPWSVINAYRRFLRTGGYIVCSIPNVRFYKVIINLIKGIWEYAEDGIMDRSHLRFFTLKSIRELIELNGFKIQTIERKITKRKTPRRLNRLFLNYLKDFLTVQYFIVASKNHFGKSNE